MKICEEWSRLNKLNQGGDVREKDLGSVEKKQSRVCYHLFQVNPTNFFLLPSIIASVMCSLYPPKLVTIFFFSGSVFLSVVKRVSWNDELVVRDESIHEERRIRENPQRFVTLFSVCYLFFSVFYYALLCYVIFPFFLNSFSLCVAHFLYASYDFTGTGFHGLFPVCRVFYLLISIGVGRFCWFRNKLKLQRV